MDYSKNLSLYDLFYINDDGLVCCEEWKDIKEYEGLYQISDLGRVKSLEKLSTSSKFIRLLKTKILKAGLATNGYYTVSLWKKKTPKTFNIHQIVTIAFLNHVPCGFELVVNHKNFIKTDNRAINFEIITNRENSNQKHLPSNSKYVGVCFDISNNKYRSSIRNKNQRINLGSFNTEIEAHNAYQEYLDLIKSAGS